MAVVQTQAAFNFDVFFFFRFVGCVKSVGGISYSGSWACGPAMHMGDRKNTIYRLPASGRLFGGLRVLGSPVRHPSTRRPLPVSLANGDRNSSPAFHAHMNGGRMFRASVLHGGIACGTLAILDASPSLLRHLLASKVGQPTMCRLHPVPHVSTHQHASWITHTTLVSETVRQSIRGVPWCLGLRTNEANAVEKTDNPDLGAFDVEKANDNSLFDNS